MRKLIPLLRPYRWMAGAAAFLVFCQALAEISLPTFMANIVDVGIVHGNTRHILSVGGVMLIVAALGMTAAFVGSRFSSRVAAGFAKDLRNRLFTHVTNFSLHEFDKVGTATLITRTTNDVIQVQQFVFMSLRMMIRAPLMAVGGIIMATAQDSRLALVLVVVIPVLALLIGWVAAKGMPLFKQVQKKLDRLNLVIREGLTGIRVVRAFNRTDYERERFHKANLDLTQMSIRVNRIMASMEPSMMFIFNVTTIGILWFGGLRVEHGFMQVGSLMAFIQYAMQIMFSLMMLSMMFVMIPRASVSASRIAEVLSMTPEIQEPVTPAVPERNAGVVEFNDVTFYYPGAETPALSNVSFQAKPGEVTAIIGGIGSGKSTLVGLLLRFYDVTDGSVSIDGVDVRKMTQWDVRRRVGYVPQSALLFSGTIEENLRYGNPKASKQELRLAIDAAQASGFIADLDGEMGAYIAQGGANFSGGQKQRLTIARALVRKPDIYVFDDNFSALDFKTDARVRAAVRKETVDKTVIIVAQRVSTIMDAAQIIVLDAGRVVGKGTHETLLEECSVYREIVASQMSEEAIV